jgi:hypothetical protein
MKLKLKTTLKFGGILAVGGKPGQVRFNKVYFTIFRAKVFKILIFEWILSAGKKKKKLQKLGLEGKIS